MENTGGSVLPWSLHLSDAALVLTVAGLDCVNSGICLTPSPDLSQTRPEGYWKKHRIRLRPIKTTELIMAQIWA